MDTRIQEKLLQVSRDPVFFIDRTTYTFDPRIAPYHLPFRLFEFQKELVATVKNAIDQQHDLFIEKCRDMGTSYAVLDTLLWYWLYVQGSNFLIGSRKQEYVDSSGTGDTANKESSLFGKLEYTLRRLPSLILPKGFDFKKHLTFMSLINPEIGNVISGESSNPNFSRAGRYRAILLDEFAFWDNDSSVWGATGDATKCRIVITTPGIRPGKAKRLRFNKDGESIKIISLPYHYDPRKTVGWLEGERSRRSSDDFSREIMINWESSVTGRVYEEIKHTVVGDYPFIPEASLYVSWDFGLDGVAIQWWQRNFKTGKKRLIDCYANSDKPIQFYFPFVGQPIDSTFTYASEDLEVIEIVKNYKNGIHYGDPDVSKRSLLTGTSTRQALQAIGVYVQTRPEANDFVSRREKTKVLLQNGIEVNKTPRTELWLECLQNARYPQRQETSQVVTEINLPIHDWTSHHRTATEYFAVNYDAARTEEQWDQNAWDEMNRAEIERIRRM